MPAEVLILAGAELGYFAAAAFLFRHYEHLINPDGVSYLSIAGDYLAGHLGFAVNAYWGPLYSWLLAPLLAIGVAGTVAARLVNVAAGGVALIAFWRMTRVLDVRAWVAAVGLALFGPLAFAWALSGPVTPDVLVVAIVLAFVEAALRPVDARWPMRTGVLGGIGYLAKSAFLPFALVVLALLLVTMRERRKPALKATVVTLAIVLAWGAILTAKYGRPTLGTSARYNLAIVGPRAQGQAMLTQGLMPPPHPGAISSWEDPSSYQVPDWKPWTTENRQFYFALVERNLDKLWWSLVSVASEPLLGALLLLSAALVDRQRRGKLALVVGAGAVLAAQYALITVEGRYLWPTWALLVAACTLGLDALAGRSRAIAGCAGAVLFALLIGYPLRALRAARGAGEDVYAVGRELPRLHGRVASNDFKSIYLCQLQEVPCFGIPAAHDSSAQVRAELDAFRINTFILYGREPTPHYLSGFHELPFRGPVRIFERELE